MLRRALVLASIGIAACVPRALEQPIDRPSPSSALTAPAPDHIGSNAPPLPDAEPAPKAPRVVVERVEGAEMRQVQRAFARVQTHVKDCAPRSATILHMRFQGDGDAVQITIQPGLGANDELRRCVLEALSTVDIEAIGTRAGPSSRPSGFTALLRVEW